MASMSITKAVNMIADMDSIAPEVLGAYFAQLDPDVLQRVKIALGFLADEDVDPEFWQVLRDGWRPNDDQAQ